MARSQPKSIAWWHKPQLRLLILAVAAAAAAGFYLLQRSAKPSAPAPTKASGYVDPAQCAACHADIAAIYAKTGMGRSFSQASPANVVEDYQHANSVFHKPSGLQYEMLERNGELFQRRSEPGSGGGEINVMEERVDYIIGSGNHSRSYLHRAPDGQLIELPVSWYSGKGDAGAKPYWAMSPGYDRKDQKDFRRAITPECMFCHNGYPSGMDEAALDRSIFPAALPSGIDCQRCHGPGQAHVEAATSHAAAQVIQSSIVNPARLSRERQLEVCMQCHLETSHHDPNEQRAFDRSIFSYRPGEPIADYKLYAEYAENKAGDSFEIAHAAYRLRRSACFRGSRMTCLTCHDPHDIPHGQEAVQHYTEICLNCHRSVVHTVALPASSTCISCHMPKRRTEDAVHVVMTDHFIRRTQPNRDLLGPIAETAVSEGSLTKLALYYPEKPPSTPQAEIALAEAQVSAVAPEGGAIDRLQALLDKYRPSAPEPYLALAKAYEKQSNEPAVVQWSLAALDRRSGYRPAIVEAIPAMFATHREAEATTLLEQAITRDPNDDILLSDLGNAYLRQGQSSSAAEVLTRSVRANPDRPESHNLLGVIALRQGEAETAEREFREALRCQPDFAEANDNLAGLLTQQEKYLEAAFYFAKAIDADPANAAAHHHYGRMLVLTNQIARAISELREAARLAPQDASVQQDLMQLRALTHAAR